MQRDEHQRKVAIGKFPIAVERHEPVQGSPVIASQVCETPEQFLAALDELAGVDRNTVTFRGGNGEPLYAFEVEKIVKLFA